MKTVARVNDSFFVSQDGVKIKSRKQVQILPQDVTVWAQSGIDLQDLQKYFQSSPVSFQQQKKINKLRLNGIKYRPANLLVPLLYKKFRLAQKFKSYLLSSPVIKKNIISNSSAQSVCRGFPQVLGHKIKYQFFGSASGRVMTNIGVIKRQDRIKIPVEKQLVQFDFSSFQPRLHRDYFLHLQDEGDPYDNRPGQTRQRKKSNWFKMTFSDKQRVFFQSPFGRNKTQTVVYHLQALQTDVMSRLINYLNTRLKLSKMIMFLYDGIIFDGDIKQIGSVLQRADWGSIFVGSQAKYPYKLVNIKELK